MEATGALNNQLLIAMPNMDDPNFSATVTLICEHNDDGALGIVINRPLGLRLGGLLEQLEVTGVDRATADRPVLDGGPVGRDRGFVLHNGQWDFESSVVVSGDVQLTLSRDILDAIAAGTGPEKSIIALGYAGWEPGQLEAEILANSWLNVTADPGIIFDVPFSDRWLTATQLLGIDVSQLSTDAGHA